MSACIYCGGLCIDPHEFPTCEKCEDAGCRDGFVPPSNVEGDFDEGEWPECKCRCHMSKADLEADAADAAYDRWKEDRED